MCSAWAPSAALLSYSCCSHKTLRMSCPGCRRHTFQAMSCAAWGQHAWGSCSCFVHAAADAGGARSCMACRCQHRLCFYTGMHHGDEVAAWLAEASCCSHVTCDPQLPQSHGTHRQTTCGSKQQRAQVAWWNTQSTTGTGADLHQKHNLPHTSKVE